MKYSIEADAEFLRVRMSGRKDDEAPSDVCKVILMESARLSRPHILIELDQDAPLSTVSQHQLVTRLPEIGMTPEHRIALVHRKPDHQDKNQYINTVGRVRDINVRNFEDTETAKAWLRTA